MKNKDFNRRDFLKLTAVGAAVVASTRVIKNTHASSGSPKGAHQWAMVIDQSKCTGCNYCTLACQANNDVNPDIQWNKVFSDGKVGNKPVYVPQPCMHCEKAPCVEVCPVKASYYREDGIVMMDYDRCIGCRYCQVACPYNARSFNWEKFEGENPAVPKWGNPEVERRPRGVPEKCSFCNPGLCGRLPDRRTHVRRPERSRISRQQGTARESYLSVERKSGDGTPRPLHRSCP